MPGSYSDVKVLCESQQIITYLVMPGSYSFDAQHRDMVRIITYLVMPGSYSLVSIEPFLDAS